MRCSPYLRGMERIIMSELGAVRRFCSSIMHECGSCVANIATRKTGRICPLSPVSFLPFVSRPFLACRGLQTVRVHA